MQLVAACFVATYKRESTPWTIALVGIAAHGTRLTGVIGIDFDGKGGLG